MDAQTPRIYRKEWKCSVCGLWTDHEEVVWSHMDGTLSTDDGQPYCVHCLPEEKS